MTVVGVPGRVVRNPLDRKFRDGRIDLDHHLIPDPLGEVLSVLIDRIGFLEARVNHLQGRASARALASAVARPPRDIGPQWSNEDCA
jgi:serine O-acetyltransferase